MWVRRMAATGVRCLVLQIRMRVQRVLLLLLVVLLLCRVLWVLVAR